MGAINQHWPRWIVASINKHFDDNLSGVTVFVEGQDRNTRGESRVAEIRVDGPWFTQLDATQWKVFIEINILLQVNMDTDVNSLSRDIYQVQRDIGQVAAAFTSGIAVYKYGSGDDDDDSLLGCLKSVMDVEGKQRIQVNNFGQIEPNTHIHQASVETHYDMILESE